MHILFPERHGRDSKEENGAVSPLPSLIIFSLTDEETQRMLKLSCNRELYTRDKRDALILFALQRKMTILDANELLFSHGFTALGVPQD